MTLPHSLPYVFIASTRENKILPSTHPPSAISCHLYTVAIAIATPLSCIPTRYRYQSVHCNRCFCRLSICCCCCCCCSSSPNAYILFLSFFLFHVLIQNLRNQRMDHILVTNELLHSPMHVPNLIILMIQDII